MTFVDRERELAALEQFWCSERAECIPVTGRRRVGKTFLLEHFAQGKRAVYYRCLLTWTPEQLPALGQALAELAGDPVLIAQPPASWAAASTADCAAIRLHTTLPAPIMPCTTAPKVTAVR